MQILHKYLFECKVIKKNFNYQIFSPIFYISPYKTCKKANIHSFFEQSYRFSCIFYIGFRYIYTSHTKYLSEKNLQGPNIRLTRTYFDFFLSQTRKLQLQGSRQGIDNFQPNLSRLTVLHDTDTNIALQDLRQLQI